MNVFYRARWRASQFDRPTGCTLVVVAMTVTASVGGCGTGVGGTGNVVDSTQSVVDGNRGSVTSGLGKTAGEPNDTFGSGVVAVFDGDGIARLEGTVSRTGDLDVFLLGGLAAGDRVVVDASTITSHIKRIRKKFAAADPDFDQIDTVHGAGYRWQAE